MLERKIKKGFASLLNYFNFISVGVIINKDGSLTGGFYYEGLDLDSKTHEERNALSVQINAVFAKLDGGWTVNIDSLRLPVKRYPLASQSNSSVIQLFEEERREHFEKRGTHYKNVYAVTLTFKPSFLQDSNFRKVFVNGQSNSGSKENDMNVLLAEFEKVMEKVQGGLLGCQISLKRMGSEELFSFLHFCITGEFQDGSKVISNHQSNYQAIESLDYVLGGYDFIAGLKPNIDGKFISVVSVLGFPLESYGGILDCLNTLPFPYRSSMRFITIDPVQAQALLVKIRTNWYNKIFSPINAVMSLVSPGAESRFGNDEAVRKAEDAQCSISESLEGLVRFGFYTHSIVVISNDEETNDKNARQLAQLLKNKGFPARIETINCVESYLGSHPGNTAANIRKPLLHSFNFAHFIPLNSPWLGSEINPHPRFPKSSPALLCASTINQTPVFCNFHVEDVGHHIICGASGYGKTVKQRALIVSYLRYKDAQIFAFDNQRGFYTITKSCGGDFYEILGEGASISFCPLQGIEDDSERLFAAVWLEELITLQTGVQVTPKQRQAISEALEALRSDKVKSLSNLYSNLMDRTLKFALDPFVKIQNGVMSQLLDAPNDSLSESHFQTFEIGGLLSLDPKFAIPVISYIFHKIETRLTGRPTLILLSETWKLFSTPFFASKINEWLRQCRAKNASVSFETHSVGDINGALKNVILTNCLTKIFLPNPLANKVNDREMYLSFGLNDAQIRLLAEATPKRQYLWFSPKGSCLVDLELQPAFLTLMGKNTNTDIEFIKQLETKFGDKWPVKYLQENGLISEARLLENIQNQNITGGN